MSFYTTGEMARLCGVSVRTVQYYDARGLLVPGQLTQGGRRLYDDADVKKMKIICFLRGIGLPLDSIRELLEADGFEKVAQLLFDEQAKQLRGEIEERRKQLEELEEMQRELKNRQGASVEALADIAAIVKNKKKLRRVHAVMLTLGIALDILEVVTLVLWIRTGVWFPFVLGLVLEIPVVVWLLRYYHRHTAYICPECHGVFRPSMKEMFWARHTPRTRKLTCAHCGYKGFCVETHADALQKT